MIVGASVFILGSYAPFTYFFTVTAQYKTGNFDHYSATSYHWKFNRFLHCEVIIINTTFPLLNHIFEYAGSYHYKLWVSNAVSTSSTEGQFIGYYVVTVGQILLIAINKFSS